MAKNLKINDLKQQQIKALSEEELLEVLEVMVVRDAKSLTQILHLLRDPENKRKWKWELEPSNHSNLVLIFYTQ